MDKIAMYEALLESHPLWNKEAASKAHAARVARSLFNKPSLRPYGGRAPAGLEQSIRQIAYGKDPRPKSAVDAARQYLREYPNVGIK